MASGGPCAGLLAVPVDPRPPSRMRTDKHEKADCLRPGWHACREQILSRCRDVYAAHGPSRYREGGGHFRRQLAAIPKPITLEPSPGRTSQGFVSLAHVWNQILRVSLGLEPALLGRVHRRGKSEDRQFAGEGDWVSRIQARKALGRSD